MSLQEKSAIAQRAGLEHYLESVTSEIRYHYSNLAERHFRSRTIPVASWMFLVCIATDGQARAVFFDPDCSCWGEPDASLVTAVHVDSAPWVRLAEQRTVLGSSGLYVDERNPESRVDHRPRPAAAR